MVNDSYFETLSAAVDAVGKFIEDERCVPACDSPIWDGGHWTEDLLAEPISYGQTRRFTIPLLSRKGKGTRSAVQVVIYRLESGRYELVRYVG